MLAALIFVYRAQRNSDALPSELSQPRGQATVLWISVDGFRHDYVDRWHPPFISKMMNEGAYSKHMRTVFPSITFASHVSEVTGTTVTHHGIPANDFYDRVSKKQLAFPSDSSLVLAEPIWRTATRQGVRTEVFDWPLSQVQHGENVPAYSDPNPFDGRQTGDQRLGRVADVYEHDSANPPLRLLMGYVEGTDNPGHKYGPDAPQTAAMVGEVDQLLQRTFDRLYADFQAKRRTPADTFYFLMTTDHGMSPVKTLVRLDFLLDLPPRTARSTETAATLPNGKEPFGTGAAHRDVIVMTSGPLGYVYLPDTLTGEARDDRITGYLAKLRAKPYLRAYRQEDLPPEWEFRSATRIGDIVVMLNDGYTFSGKIPLAEYPVEKGDGPRGMHGYPVEETPNMEGFILMWRSTNNWGGKNLGIVHAVQFHATVANWLGINPAPGSAPPIAP